MKKLLYCILTVIVLFGCAKKGQEATGQVLAKVGSRAITMEDFNKRLASIPPMYQESIKQNKALLLDDLITEEVLYKEALKRRVGSNPEVKSLLQEAEKRILVARLIKEEIEDKSVLTDTQIEDYYNANKDEFISPEMYRASHILIADLKDAVKVVDRLNSGGDFEELAKVHSIDVTNTRGGDVGYFALGQMVPEFEDAVVKLKVGEIASAPVKTQFGYHIIKLTDKKEPAPMEFDKIKDRIRMNLSNTNKRKLFDNLVSNLKTKYKVTRNLELFDSLTQEAVPEEIPMEIPEELLDEELAEEPIALPQD